MSIIDEMKKQLVGNKSIPKKTNTPIDTITAMKKQILGDNFVARTTVIPEINSVDKQNIKYATNPNLKMWDDSLAKNKKQYEQEKTLYNKYTDSSLYSPSKNTTQGMYKGYLPVKQQPVEKSKFMKEYEKIQDLKNKYDLNIDDNGKIELNDSQIKEKVAIYNATSMDMTVKEDLAATYTPDTLLKLENEMDYDSSTQARTFINRIKKGELFDKENVILWDDLDRELADTNMNDYWKNKVTQEAKQFQVETFVKESPIETNLMLAIDSSVGAIDRGYYNSKIGNDVGVMVHQGKLKEADEYITKHPMKKGMYEKWNEKGIDITKLETNDDFLSPSQRSGMDSAVSGAFGLGGQVGAQMNNPITALTTLTGAIIGGTAGLLSTAGPGLIPGMVSGAKLGLRIGNAYGGAAVETGFSYIELRERGIDADMARNTSSGVGVVNGVLEYAQFGNVLDFIGKASVDLGAKQIAKAYVKDVITNTIQEIAQQGVTIAGRNIASAASDLPTDDWDVILDELIETGKSSLITFALFNLPGTTVNTSSYIANVSRNKQGQLVYDEKRKNAYIAEIYESLEKAKNINQVTGKIGIIEASMNGVELSEKDKQAINAIMLAKQIEFIQKDVVKQEKATPVRTETVSQPQEVTQQPVEQVTQQSTQSEPHTIYTDIDNRINALIDTMTEIKKPIAAQNEFIYNEVTQLRNQRIAIEERLSEELKEQRNTAALNLSEEERITKVKELEKQVKATNTIPEAKQTEADKIKTVDKVEQIDTITKAIEKDKPIKVLSNKQYVEANRKILYNNAQFIIDTINNTAQYKNAQMEIVTELTDEQLQVENLGKIFGKQVIFTKGMQTAGMVLPQNSKLLFVDINANPGIITSKNENATMIYVVGHELFHSLKASDPKTYNEFIKYIKTEINTEQVLDFMKKYDPTDSQGLMEGLKIDGKFDINLIKDNGSQYTEQDKVLSIISEEMVSHEFGRILTDKQYMTDLRTKNPGIFKLIVDSIRKLFKSLEGSIFDSSLTQLQVENIRQRFENNIVEIEEKLAKEEAKNTKETTPQKETTPIKKLMKWSATENKWVEDIKQENKPTLPTKVRPTISKSSQEQVTPTKVKQTLPKKEVKPATPKKEAIIDATVTVHKMELDDRFNFVEKTVARYNNETGAYNKNIMLETALKAYKNYKKDGGTKSNEILDTAIKNKSTLKTKQLPNAVNKVIADSKGNLLKPGQIKKFGKSKALNIIGNLVNTYHTMKFAAPQFNIFNPAKDSHYKFQENDVMYATDSQIMSGSYANQNYLPADTEKLTSVSDVEYWLDMTLGSGSDASEIDGYTYDFVKSINYNNTYYLKIKDKNTYKNFEFVSDEDLFKNIREKTASFVKELQHKFQYEGYLDIQNPNIVEGYGHQWNNIRQKVDIEEIKKYDSLPVDIKKELHDLALISAGNYFNSLDETDFITPPTNQSEYFYEHASDLLRGTNIRNDEIVFIIAKDGFKPDKILRTFTKTQSTNDIVKETIKENTKKIEKYVSKTHVTVTKKNYIEILRKAGGQDGIIINDIIDYGGVTYTSDPATVYAIFSSNQFKSIDNLNPTDDLDTRYLPNSIDGTKQTKTSQTIANTGYFSELITAYENDYNLAKYKTKSHGKSKQEALEYMKAQGDDLFDNYMFKEKTDSFNIYIA